MAYHLQKWFSITPMNNFEVTRTVLCGSFRRDPAGLQRAYRELITTGCQVLSPHRLAFVSSDEDFVKDLAETNLSIREIEQHHLVAISQADFVWLYAPEGYIGVSAAFEIGYAIARQIPVFCNTPVKDETMRNFIHTSPSVFAAKESLTRNH